jgi:hypothetical protein
VCCYVNPNFEKIDHSLKKLRYDTLQLHFYSDHAGRLVVGGGQNDYWNTEVYPLESIKEFEAVSKRWRQLLNEMLRKGSIVFTGQISSQPIY